MSKEQDWLALTAHCKKTTGSDRKIDREIGLATGWRAETDNGHPMLVDWDGDWYSDHPGSMYPSPTESLDVITALIERQFPGGAWVAGYGKLSPDEPMGGARIFFDQAGNHLAGAGEGATVALALCAAFCRAMAEKQTTPSARPSPQLSGDACGNFALVRTGTCQTCQACGETKGCS